MEESAEGGQSSMHWQNKNALQATQTQNGILMAELIREYLEFYKLDYTKQIFVPETNLERHPTSINDVLAMRAGINEPQEEKPLLL